MQVKLLFLIGILSSSLLMKGQTQIGQDIDNESPNDFFGGALAVSSDGDIVAVGAVGNDGNGPNSGHVRVFENLNGTWTQIGQDLDGEAAGDSSGSSVSISGNGNIVAIGAFGNDDNGNDAGHVRVYEYQSGVWTQIGQDIDGSSDTAHFGIAVNLSSDGTILGVGASGNDDNGNNTGLVKVFQNQGGSWVQIGQTLNGAAVVDFFGFGLVLSSSGNIIAVGIQGFDDNDPNVGQVKVFENINNTWTQIGQDINGEGSNDFSGRAIAISSDGSIIAIGSDSNSGNGSNSGHVRVFENINNVWTQIGQDIDGQNVDEFFGFSLDISSNGSILAVGANGNDENGPDSGQARIYENQNGNWVQVGTDINGDVNSNQLGRSISVSSDGLTVAVGAIGNGGYVRVFDLSDVLSTSESTITNFSLYPNPAQNSVNVSLSESDILQQATIFNSLGQKVLSSTQETMDISSLSKGVYIIEVITNLGKGTQKLIVQ